jgi:hypothetical protein
MKNAILILSLIITVAAAIAFANEIEDDPTFWETLAHVSGFIFCIGIIGKILDLWTTGKK